jgi:hypothetical protein
MVVANLNMILGLRALGYEVHYLERQNDPNDCYDLRSSLMTDDPSFALGYLADLLPRFGMHADRYSFIDRDNRCHGSGWPALRRALEGADFVLTMSDPIWFDELELCPKRAFIDTDPLFTQVALHTGEGRPPSTAAAIEHYDVLFTEALRIGRGDCTIPLSGRTWIPTRPAIDTSLWCATPPPTDAPITTIMNWAAWDDVEFGGVEYGHKDREFERFLTLPSEFGRPFAIAAGGPAPRDRLHQFGWQLVDPLAVTGTIDAYQRFIAASWADFGIAKHAYVASRSGWFSDRSMCYLASGRPVLHQDTGCGDWLPAGEGVLLFSTMEDVLHGLERLTADYERHARAARAIAEDYFEAEKVVGRMLDAGGLR